MKNADIFISNIRIIKCPKKVGGYSSYYKVSACVNNESSDRVFGVLYEGNNALSEEEVKYEAVRMVVDKTAKIVVDSVSIEYEAEL